MPKHPEISVCIPTSRQDDLETCLKSIYAQTFKDYEVLIDGTTGELARIRNNLASRAKGNYLIFIDDDVITVPRWLSAIVKSFRTSESIAGVSGPSVLYEPFRRKRDLFKFRFFKWIYDQFFCDGRHSLPGHFTASGAWTTGASEPTCNYEGEVQFLEACNMAFKHSVFDQCNGFDVAYRGIGDWSEPDLSFRIRQLGYKLWFSRNAWLEHRPSRSGAYKKRSSDSRNRLSNYELFSKRWIKPSLKHQLYKWFLRAYYAYSSLK